MTQPTEYMIGFSAGASACMYIFRQVRGMVLEGKKPNGNGTHVCRYDDDVLRDIRDGIRELIVLQRVRE